MLIAGSLWRKTIVTALAAAAFVSLYEVTILDSRFAARESAMEESEAPEPGQHLTFTATAYCKGLVTTAGVAVQSGIAAADPALLPVGSVIQLDAETERNSGIYTVLDTGPAIQGRQVDIYMWNCNQALQFGRQSVRLVILRLGWNPRATTPSFMERLFKRASPTPPLPARPLPMAP